MWCSHQVTNERMTEIRNENEQLRLAAEVAEESYQKLLADKTKLELEFNRAKLENSHLMQQVSCCNHILIV